MTPRQGDNPNERRGRQSSGSENQGQPYQQPTRQTGQQGQHTSQGHQQSSQRQQPTQYQQPSPQQQHGTQQSGHTQQSQMGSSQQSRRSTHQSQMGSQTGPPQRSSQHQQGGGHASQHQGGTYQQSAPQQTSGQGMGTQQRSQQSGHQPPHQQSQFQSQQGAGMGTPQQSTGHGMSTQHTGGQMGGQQMGGQQMGTQGGRSHVQMRPITIEDIVETEVVTAETDTPIATVIAQMSENDVGSVVIVEDDSPVGIVTDREIALALEDTPDIAEQQAGDLVSGDLVTATTSMTVFDALRRISDEKVRRLPIVDDDGELQGIISLDDILVLLGSELNRVGETIQAQSPRL